MKPTAAALTPEIIKDHNLSPEEYRRILELLGREPSMTELGIFSVMWSEHCSYKSSRVHLKRLPTRSERVVQGPGENAGIIDVGDGWACAFKIESHNHPSFIEPFQGAATGVGGILRDVFTMGARPLAVMDSLRFGPIEGGKAERNTVHRNHSIMEGVVSGIASYGNCFGVPNLGGETRFEDCYSQNPLVNAFALGMLRRDEIFYARAAGEGNPVIYVGAKTGRDGIHGATMASEEFSEESEAKRPNVQVGDPFLEKLLLEACLEAMKTGAVVAIQDMGAAGLTSSSSEMGGRGGVGIDLDLDRVPQRETGMTAYEMMLSESQERMLLVAEKGREAEVFRVFEKWGLDAVTCGLVTLTGKLRVFHQGRIEAEIPNGALTDDAPRYQRPLEPFTPAVPRSKPAGVNFSGAGDFTGEFKRLLASPNICSKRWVFEQYDTMVQTNTVEGPGADAGVMRIKGTRRALAMSLEGNGRWCYLAPKLGAMHAVAGAARNVACSGAAPAAATNCLNLGNPEKPPIMWQFVEVVDGIAAACEALGTPITGGNVSLYNETLGEAIYPTPVVGVVGILEQVDRVTRFHFPASGRSLLLLHAGHKPADEQEFGSSEYARHNLGALWGAPPSIDLAKEAALHKCLAELSSAGLPDSAHDCSDGGIAVALAESCFPAGVGARVDLSSTGLPTELVLFGEAASRVVISCVPEKAENIKQIAVKYGLAADLIGQTVPDKLAIRVDGNTAIAANLSELYAVWDTALAKALHTDTAEELAPNVLQRS